MEQEVRWHGPVNCKLQVGVFTLLVSGGIAWPVPFGRIAHPTSPGQPRPSTPSPSPSPPRRGWTGFPPSSASSSPGDTAVHPASGVESRSPESIAITSSPSIHQKQTLGLTTSNMSDCQGEACRSAEVTQSGSIDKQKFQINPRFQIQSIYFLLIFWMVK